VLHRPGDMGVIQGVRPVGGLRTAERPVVLADQRHGTAAGRRHAVTAITATGCRWRWLAVLISDGLHERARPR